MKDNRIKEFFGSFITFRIFLFVFFIILFKSSSGQELYPNTEPASTIPKGVLGLRLMDESFNENGTLRNQITLRAMYGFGSKLSGYVQTDFSNHHDTILPRDLLTHTHATNGQALYNAQTKVFGRDYPYLAGGLFCYLKYRFYTRDEQQSHLRMALYAEASNTDVAHDEAEPGLDGDSKGFGGGIIITKLEHRFAATFSGGFIFPGTYHDFRVDYSLLPPDGPELHTQITYGKALDYNLSLGYLLYPSEYRDYNQININIYLELMGRSYEEATITRNGIEVMAQTPTLGKGHYLNAIPGIQAILNSNTRIDFSIGFPLINRSYRYFYPLFLTGIQRYFYFKK